MNTITLLEWLAQDIRYAARMLRRSPGFTIAAVLTLALGIGGVTVIYSALRNILLDPFPYVKSDRMVNVFVTDAETGNRHYGGRMGQDESLDFLEQQTAFEAVVVSADDIVVMRSASGSDIVVVTEMTPNTFPYLGVSPLKGRVFTEDDARPGAAPVVVLDHGVWVDKFGGRDEVLGQVVTVGDTPRTIIGVMPPRFAWQAPDMWVPLTLRRGATPPDERPFAYQAHLAPGVTLAEASERMTAIAQRRAQLYPDQYPKRVRVDVLDLRYRVVGRFSNVLFTLLGAVVLLLFIACCNVANMLLARATTREREMTLRAALGGGRLRLMVQLLTESGLLALGGALGGCLLAWGGIRAIARILPGQGIAAEVQLRLVPEALIASLALAVITTLIVGIVPAWNASRQDLANGMKDSGKGTGAGHKHGWIRQGLVVAEVAISLVLLFGAGLLIRSFATLVSTDLGVDPAGIASVSPRFEHRDEPGIAERHLYYADALARARTVPGVTDTALVSTWPYGGWPMAATRPGVEPPADARRVIATFSDEHYLGLVRLHPLRGRAFTPADISSGAHVTVISRSLAERYFGQEDPLGQYLDLPDLAKAPALLTDTRFSVIGVVEDVRNQGPSEVPWPGVYLPTTLTAVGNTPRRIVVRTAGDAASGTPRPRAGRPRGRSRRRGAKRHHSRRRAEAQLPRAAAVQPGHPHGVCGHRPGASGRRCLWRDGLCGLTPRAGVCHPHGARRDQRGRGGDRRAGRHRAARGGHRHWSGGQSDDEPPGGELRRDGVGRRRRPVVRPGRRRGHRAGRTSRLSNSGPPCFTDEPNGRVAAGLTPWHVRCCVRPRNRRAL